jgi:FkbM family methyltransferase
MSFTKKILVPDFIYSARVLEEDIPYFESQFYQRPKLYSSTVKETPERFEFAKRIGYVYMNMLAKTLEPVREKYNIESLGDKGFDWHFLPELMSSAAGIFICAGAGTNVSFEVELAHSWPGNRVLLLDPSPQAVGYVEGLSLPKNLQFIQEGLSDQDGILKFHKPSTHGVGSLSVHNLHPSEQFFELPVTTIKSLVQKNSIAHGSDINYLKFDIEGAEHEVVSHLVENDIRPKQIAFEFDQPVPPWTVENTMLRLINFGYEVIDIWGLNILFIDKQYLSA